MNTVTAQADRKPSQLDSAANIQPQSTRAGHRFGRSAWILHGLAYVFFLSAWGVMLLLGENSEESQPVQGVGGAAAIVLSLWSLVLSIRALIAAERPLLPVLNIALVMLEITVPCVAAWWPLLLNYNINSPVFEIAIALGLPIFMPFVLMGSAIAAPFAYRLTVRAERREAKQGGEAWAPRQRWRFGGLRFVVVLGLLALLSLPLPLYFFATLSTGGSNAGVLQRAVQYATPAFVKTGAYRLLDSSPKSAQLKYRFLLHGALPDNFLLGIVNDKNDPLSECAFQTVYIRNLQDGLLQARKISKDPQSYSSQVQYHSGILLGLHGSPEDVGDLFPAKGVVNDPLRTGLYYGLRANTRKEMIPVLFPMLDFKELVSRRFAMHVLAHYTKTALNKTPQPGSIAEAPGELEELETVRAAAKKAMQP